MKGIVVFDTSYGNMKTIAQTISETLRESGLEVDVFHVKDVKKPKHNGLQFPGCRFSNPIWNNEPCSQRLSREGEE